MVAQQQLELSGLPKKKSRPPRSIQPAATNPIAAVSVSVKAVAVDRPFDYLVPAALDDSVRPGSRVRVRFHGRLVDGIVLSRAQAGIDQSRLLPIRNVVSKATIDPATLDLARAVATRYAGTLAELLRDIVPRPPAKAAARIDGQFEGRQLPVADGLDVSARPRRTLVSVPTTVSAVDWIANFIDEHAGPLVVLVPDHHILSRLRVALAQSQKRIGVLGGEDGLDDRYRVHLQALYGDCDVVIGTRNACFAPLSGADLLMWSDSDESYVQPRSPGWNARDVLALRSHLQAVSLTLAGYTTSVEAARFVAVDWMESVRASGSGASTAPTILTAHASYGAERTKGVRMPGFAWRVLRDGIEAGGPVLVQVARSGYYPYLVCEGCRTPADCPQCSHALGRGEDGEVTCPLCGWDQWKQCTTCGEVQLRPARVGSSRTAYEIEKAFPQARVVLSGSATGILPEIPPQADVVVATVGAEPIGPRKYRSALLLDGDVMLARADLRTEESVLRRWFGAVALVDSRESGGVVAVTADPSHSCVQALLRADPAGWARRVLDDRTELRLPPSVRAAVVVESSQQVSNLVEEVHRAHHDWVVMGPLPDKADRLRAVLLVPHAYGSQLENLMYEQRKKIESGRDRGCFVRIDPFSLLESP